MEKFRQFIYDQHDIVCNQKYADNLPYSTHLSFVEAQGMKFIHLVKEGHVFNELNRNSIPQMYKNIVRHALIAHDCIEDARMTYNNLVSKVNSEDFGNYTASIMVADIVYCVTDEKGKSRSDRKNAKYYDELMENELALFVKLADLAANTLFSKLSGSCMYAKYKAEWPKFKNRLFIPKYEEFFNYIENI